MHTISYNCFAEKALLKKRKKHSRIALAVIIILSPVIFLSSFWYKTFSANASFGKVFSPVPEQRASLNLTQEELRKYDGTNANLPIYLALDGVIYDISRGGEFYTVGGPYHYLAGRDSSDILHVLGENIIQGKYSAVGRYINQ